MGVTPGHAMIIGSFKHLFNNKINKMFKFTPYWITLYKNMYDIFFF